MLTGTAVAGDFNVKADRRHFTHPLVEWLQAKDSISSSRSNRRELSGSRVEKAEGRLRIVAAQSPDRRNSRFLNNAEFLGHVVER